YLLRLPATTRLIFLESKALPDNHRIIRLADNEKVGYVRKFDEPKGNDLERWVRVHVEERGGHIAPQAASLLATKVAGERDERVGHLPVLQALTKEVEKLVLYKGSEATIEAADVVLLSPYAAEETIVELVDALGNRQPARSAELFQAKIT